MRTLLLISVPVLLLCSCSPQDKEKAHEDASKTTQEVRKDLKVAGSEIKKDLHAADEQLKDSMEKGRTAARHAAKELRKDLTTDEPETKRSDLPRKQTTDTER